MVHVAWQSPCSLPPAHQSFRHHDNQREHDGGRRDHIEGAQRSLDVILESDPGNQDRHRANDDQSRHSGIRRGEWSAPHDTLDPCPCQPHNTIPGTRPGNSTTGARRGVANSITRQFTLPGSPVKSCGFNHQTPSLVRGHHPHAQRIAHQAGGVVDVEGLAQLLAVHFHRFDADGEGLGNFLGRTSFRDELQNFALAGC